jgi:hypothetical protein
VMGRRTTEHRMRQRGWSPDHRVERRATGSHRQSGGLARRRGAGHRQRLRQVAERPARCTRAAASRLAVSICGVGDVRSPSGGGLVLSQAVDPVGLTSFVWRSSPIGDVRRDLMERGSAPSKPCRRTSSIRKGERTSTRPIIVLGADTHKSSHTIAAVNSATGRGARSSAGAAVGWGSSPNRGVRKPCGREVARGFESRRLALFVAAGVAGQQRGAAVAETVAPAQGSDGDLLPEGAKLRWRYGPMR